MDMLAPPNDWLIATHMRSNVIDNFDYSGRKVITAISGPVKQLSGISSTVNAQDKTDIFWKLHQNPPKNWVEELSGELIMSNNNWILFCLLQWMVNWVLYCWGFCVFFVLNKSVLISVCSAIRNRYPYFDLGFLFAEDVTMKGYWHGTLTIAFNGENYWFPLRSALSAATKSSKQRIETDTIVNK